MKYQTRAEVTTRTTPIGINTKPMIKNTGKAVFAVMIGCHAGKRCCLKAVSIHQTDIHSINEEIYQTYQQVFYFFVVHVLLHLLQELTWILD